MKKEWKIRKREKTKIIKREIKYELKKITYVLTIIRSRLLVPEIDTKKLEGICLWLL